MMAALTLFVEFLHLFYVYLFLRDRLLYLLGIIPCAVRRSRMISLFSFTVIRMSSVGQSLTDDPMVTTLVIL